MGHALSQSTLQASHYLLNLHGIHMDNLSMWKNSCPGGHPNQWRTVLMGKRVPALVPLVGSRELCAIHLLRRSHGTSIGGPYSLCHPVLAPPTLLPPLSELLSPGSYLCTQALASGSAFQGNQNEMLSSSTPSQNRALVLLRSGPGVLSGKGSSPRQVLLGVDCLADFFLRLIN